MLRMTFLGCLLLLSLVSYSQDRFLQPDGVELVTDSYIVVFRDDIRGVAEISQTAASLAADYGTATDRIYRHAINGAAMRMSEAAARELSQDPRVRYVEQDAISLIVGDQTAPPAWGIDRVDERQLPLDNNYHWDFDGSGVDIHILDTGIRTSHNDFSGRASWGLACIGSQVDDHGHGTHVAGTAAGNVFGVAKDADLIATKICDSLGQCPNSAILCGIDYVTQQKQSRPSTPMVANMSVSGGVSQAINDAIDTSVGRGVFYAVAAGNNDGLDACSTSPASAARAYAAASSTQSDRRSSFSNIGSCVDIFAPGSSILSAWNTSNTATATISGTSMASPHVAGAAALVLEQTPNATPAAVDAELDARATTGAIANPGDGSPNRLLYTLDQATPPPDPPSEYTLLCSADDVVDGADPACDGGTFPDRMWIYLWPEEGVRRVTFYLDGEQRTVENYGPWELDGQRPTNFTDGVHSVDAEIEFENGGNDATAATFTVGGGSSPPPPPPPSAHRLLCSTDNTVDGNDPDCAGGQFPATLWVYLWPENNVSRVIFHLDGAQRNIENRAPWEVDGRNATVFADGSHSVEADIDLDGGGNELAVASFTVGDASPPPPPPTGYRLLCSTDRVVNGNDPDCDGGLFPTRLWVYLWPEDGVRRVTFYLDGTQETVENYAPWELDGRSATNFATGPHTVDVQIGLDSGGVQSLSVDFSNGVAGE